MSTMVMSRRAAQALDATRRRLRGDAEPTPVELLYEAIDRALDVLERYGWPGGEIIDNVYSATSEAREEVVIWRLDESKGSYVFDADGNLIYFTSRLGWQTLSRRTAASLGQLLISSLTDRANSIADRLLSGV